MSHRAPQRPDASGLIDIRALAAQMAEASAQRAAQQAPRRPHVPEPQLPSFAAPMLLGPPLVAPPPRLPPSAPHPGDDRRRRLVYAMLTALTFAVIGLSMIIVLRPATTIVVERPRPLAAPSVAAASQREAQPSPRPAIPQELEAAVPDDGVDRHVRAGDDPRDVRRPSGRHVSSPARRTGAQRGVDRRRPESRRRPADPGTKASLPDAGPSVDCILGTEKCKRTTAPPLQREPKAPPKPAGPAMLSIKQVRDGLAPVKARAKSCLARSGAQTGTRVEVKLSIDGSTGRVRSAAARAPHASSAMGRCVARALSTAKFPRFAKPRMGFVYTVRS